MNKLPNDYSRCCNEECPLRYDCMRYLAWITPLVGYVSNHISVTEFKFNEDGTCDNLIDKNE